ncbi:putative xylanase/chitin deacetylase [Flavobacterium saliperosum S13]|uniref:Polysaccharide deacetylase n=2 Tax=Flavobacterium saliperosum TaxID=329186 RepID=A0A1G4VSE9_9FLAO|nr:polysaccharide deacetylase family protein [Flavobacterium saliperosum]ESU24031.1 putative xylanase/chitin deacetylase [Flavobacterium saliperosum S13]SCX11136.1 Polysaccharide deacetylase [Flavobacterium saliperosum]
MTRLPILMYHNVTNDEKMGKGLTIAAQKLESHFRYLSENNYVSFHLSELENKTAIPEKSIVITFDDVTENQLLAVELLQKYNLKATFFIPFAYVGKTDEWNNGSEKIMTYDQLRNLPENIELGLHSYAHKKYANLSETECYEDFGKCFRSSEENNLKVYSAVAYPYGNYPKNEPKKSKFKSVLQQNNIKMGLRIGNKINKFPFKNPYEIMRIDVKGDDSLLKFKLKLRFGKLKLF